MAADRRDHGPIGLDSLGFVSSGETILQMKEKDIVRSKVILSYARGVLVVPFPFRRMHGLLAAVVDRYQKTRDTGLVLSQKHDLIVQRSRCTLIHHCIHLRHRTPASHGIGNDTSYIMYAVHTSQSYLEGQEGRISPGAKFDTKHPSAQRCSNPH